MPAHATTTMPAHVNKMAAKSLSGGSTTPASHEEPLAVTEFPIWVLPVATLLKQLRFFFTYRLRTDANGRNALRMTPLHLAARNGHTPIVERLLAEGADPRLKDRWGRTAEDWARRMHHDALSARLRGGARVMARRGGITPQQAAMHEAAAATAARGGPGRQQPVVV